MQERVQLSAGGEPQCRWQECFRAVCPFPLRFHCRTLGPSVLTVCQHVPLGPQYDVKQTELGFILTVVHLNKKRPPKSEGPRKRE